ncbi:hypothetical protein BN946_scf184905.g1, partial [Trametes cinnabarina]
PISSAKGDRTPVWFADISQKRLDELISSEDNGEDDEEPEVSRELAADAGEDKANESDSSEEED